NITIDQSFTSKTQTLSFYSNGNLTINNGVSLGTTSGIVLKADNNSDGIGILVKLGSLTLNSGSNTITIQSASDISSSTWLSGATFGGANIYATGNSNIIIDQSYTGKTQVLAFYANGDLTINNGITLATSSTITLKADNDANGSGDLIKAGTATLTAGTSSTMTLQSASDITASTWLTSATFGGLEIRTTGSANITIDVSIDKSFISSSIIRLYSNGNLIIDTTISNIAIKAGQNGYLYLYADYDENGSGTLSKTGSNTLSLCASTVGIIYLHTVGDLTTSNWLSTAVFKGYSAWTSGTLTVDTTMGATSSSITLKADYDSNGVGDLVISPGTIIPLYYASFYLQGANSFTLSAILAKIIPTSYNIFPYTFSLTSTAGDITADAYIQVDGMGGSFILQAAGNIAINENIGWANNGPPMGSLTCTLKADYNEDGVGNLTFTAGKVLGFRATTYSGATITFQGANSFILSSDVLDRFQNGYASLSITIISTAGNITIDRTLYASTSGLSFKAAGNLTINSGISLYNAGPLTLMADTNLDGTGSLIFSGSNTITVGMTSNKDLTLQDSANITTSTLFGYITGRGTRYLSVTSTAGSITIDSAISHINNITLSAENGIVQNANVTSLTGDITLNADNDADGVGALTMSSGTSLNNPKAKSIAITASGTSTLKDITCGNLTITGAASGATFSAGSSTLTISGNLTFGSNATFTADTSTVLFNGSYSKLTSNGQALNNLTINNAQGYVQLQDACDINGNLTITAGTLDANGKTINLAGNWTNSGTFTHNNGTVTFDGIAAQTITGSTTFYNLIIANTHASDEVTISSGTVTVANLLDVNDGIFTVETGTTLDVNYTDVDAVDVLSGATLRINGGTFTVDGGNYSQLHVNSGAFLDIVSGTVTITGSLNLEGRLKMAAGTLTIGNTTDNKLSVSLLNIGSSGGAYTGDVTGGTITILSHFTGSNYIINVIEGGKFLPAITTDDTGNIVILAGASALPSYILNGSSTFSNVIFNRLQIGDASHTGTLIQFSMSNTAPLNVYNKLTIYAGSTLDHTWTEPQDPFYVDKFICDGTYVKNPNPNMFFMINGDGIAGNGVISGLSDPNFGNLDIGNGSAVTVTLGHNITADSLDIALNGVLNTGSGYDLNINGNVNIAGTLTVADATS
ncbi:MAG: hypothetical protein WCT15_06775, partial [Candidatus Omnitrophota bacterium]